MKVNDKNLKLFTEFITSNMWRTFALAFCFFLSLLPDLL